MTPSKTELETLRAKIRSVYRLAGVEPLTLSPAAIPKVVVLLGSSRSGSSLLFHLLSQSGAFWAPQGEETPFYRASGLGWVTVKEHSDALRGPVDATVRENAFGLLLNDLGRRPAAIDNRYLAQCATRVLLQWPELDLSPEQIFAALSSSRSADAASLWINLTARLSLETGFYDLPGPKSRNLQFEAPRYVLEEPPYILQTPREAPTPESLSENPVLLKTSTNAYRLPWLKTLFPHSEFRFVVLGRNPAASINGLIDGWLSNAFHSHNLEFVQPLSIKGYSDSVAFGDRWWKFDLPPGWNDYDNAPLAEVCAFQWRAAYKAILDGVSGPVLNVKTEDLLDPGKSASTLGSIFKFCGTDPHTAVDPLRARPVMASQAPLPARWRLREEEIWPHLQHPGVQEIAQRLNYDLSSPDGLL